MKHTLIFILCGLIFLGHLWAGWATGDCSWLTRSGTSIVAVGVLLESWKVIIIARADQTPTWQSPEGLSAIRAAVLIICVGTIIQGYADLPFRNLICP